MALPFKIESNPASLYGCAPAPAVALPDSRFIIPDQYVGIELEMEGLAKVPKWPPFWTRHDDGSLRNGLELVTDGPKMGTSLVEALDSIAEFFHAQRNRTLSSFRTSTHVHLDFTRSTKYGEDVLGADTLYKAQNVALLYYALEPAFYAVAGKDRELTGYCYSLGASVIDFVEWLASSRGQFRRDTSRYYGLNFSSLVKFGTMEFRHMPLIKDTKEITRWVNVLMRLKRHVYIALSTTDSPEYLSDPDALRAAGEYVFAEYPDALASLDWGRRVAAVTRINTVLDAIAGNTRETREVAENAPAPSPWVTTPDWNPPRTATRRGTETAESATNNPLTPPNQLTDNYILRNHQPRDGRGWTALNLQELRQEIQAVRQQLTENWELFEEQRLRVRGVAAQPADTEVTSDNEQGESE